MTDATQSKFVAFFDSAANPVNRRPNMTGEYRLAGEGLTSRIALWGGVSAKTGKLYARGKVTPNGVSEALRASTTAQDVEGPANIDLAVGEIVLFENPKATADNKQPKFYGYARESGRYLRLAGWEKGNVVIGSVEPYRPAEHAGEVEAPTPQAV